VKFTVWVKRSALDEIAKEAAQDPDLEVGGVLMGYWSEDAGVITVAIGAGPAAVKRRRSFHPDSEWQFQEIARIYRESGRTTTYLGDWHYHRRLPPLPSLLDVKTAGRISQAKESRAPNPLMAIVGQDPLSGTPLLAVYRYDRRRLNACKVVIY
jgi:integrative and conjugative element protein (TIGR02256 family)